MLSVDELYKEYAQMIYRYLFSLTQNSDLAEELTQETFYQAIRTIKNYREDCKISTWLCSIAKNVWRSYLRKHPRTDILLESEQSPDSVESVVLASLDKVQLLKLIYTLDNSTRDVVYLRLFGDLSFKEIGEVLGKTENWARVTFYRGKEKIRKELDLNEK